MEIVGLGPSAPALLAGVLIDAAIGDPDYRLHPIRIMGRNLTSYERLLRALGWDGYAGGITLFLLLTTTWVVLPSLLVVQIYSWSPTAGFVIHVFLVYSLLALRDLMDHVWSVQRSARHQDLIAAREAIGRLVGRDTSMMDLTACRRAAIESLAENFVDGFLSPVFFYVLFGLPGLLLFKVVSTMDSMVGYKAPKYLRFGWCGARLDDLFNYLPARLAWLILGMAALVLPGLSAIKGWHTGLTQHAVVPGPNPGWSEATMAGVLQRRLIGPIYKDGQLVTTLWLGTPSDPAGGTDQDLTNSKRVTLVASAFALAVGVILLSWVY
jgi:adenosylcobinamide-phosphate synthase